MVFHFRPPVDELSGQAEWICRSLVQLYADCAALP